MWFDVPKPNLESSKVARTFVIGCAIWGVCGTYGDWDDDFEADNKNLEGSFQNDLYFTLLPC